MSRDLTYVLDIYQSAQIIREHVKNLSKTAFKKDIKTQDAVIRRIEIIGEATKRLSNEIRSAHPEIPWKEMAGMRDVVIHDYDEVDLDFVWAVANEAVPRLIEQLAPLVPPDNDS
jgi:uncharacterized protein with HEPN domain